MLSEYIETIAIINAEMMKSISLPAAIPPPALAMRIDNLTNIKVPMAIITPRANHTISFVMNAGCVNGKVRKAATVPNMIITSRVTVSAQSPNKDETAASMKAIMAHEPIITSTQTRY